jgi:hypothetical protein
MTKIKFIFITLLVMTLMSCPNKSSDNNYQTNNNTNVIPNCLNCQNINGGVFLTTDSRESGGYLNLKLQLSGAVGAQQYGAYYSGIVATQYAEMSVSQPIYYGSCQLPVGNYQLSTYEQGQYSQGILQNLRLISGQNGMVVRIWNAQIASPNQRDGNGYLLPIQRLYSVMECNVGFQLF